MAPATYSLGTRLRGKHAQYARTTADIQHCLALKEVLVFDNAVHVAARSDFIFQHLLRHESRQASRRAGNGKGEVGGKSEKKDMSAANV